MCAGLCLLVIVIKIQLCHKLYIARKLYVLVISGEEPSVTGHSHWPTRTPRLIDFFVTYLLFSHGSIHTQWSSYIDVSNTLMLASRIERDTF